MKRVNNKFEAVPLAEALKNAVEINGDKLPKAVGINGNKLPKQSVEKGYPYAVQFRPLGGNNAGVSCRRTANSIASINDHER